MSALTAGQIPRVANIPNGGVGIIAASANTVTLGSDTNGATCYTAGAYGGIVRSLTAVTDDTVTINVMLYIYRTKDSAGNTVTGYVIPIGLVNIPLSSGNTNAAKYNVDFLDGNNILGLQIDSQGKRYIELMPSDVLKVGALANLTAAKSCWVRAEGKDFQA